jgi:CubicO group peptidase (beta-lactamase class C family)
MARKPSADLYRLFCLIILFSTACCLAPAFGQCTAPLDDADDDWTTVSLTQAGVKSEPIAGMIRAIQRGVYKNIHCVLLVRGGRLCLEEYFQGYDRDKIHEIRSATKSIGSVLVGIAIDRGYLCNLKEPIWYYFKDRTINWDNRSRAVTIQNLLTMTSGFACDDHGSEPFQCERGMYKADDWVNFALHLPMAHRPGDHWAYNSASLILLSEIIRQNTGRPVSLFAEEYLMAPLGITDIHWGFSPKGRIWLAGNASMRPRDMAKFGQMCLNKGFWQNRRIVSEKWLAESTRFHVHTEFGMEYGYLWWRGYQTINNQQIEAYWAQGNGGQVIFICPVLDLVAVFTGGNYNSIHEFQFMGILINYILPAMLPPVPKKTFISLDKQALMTLSGKYRCHRLQLHISQEKDKVVGQLAGIKVPIFFEDNDHFFIPNPIFGNMNGMIIRDHDETPVELLINSVFSKLRFKKIG